jgi:hypothetical protein
VLDTSLTAICRTFAAPRVGLEPNEIEKARRRLDSLIGKGAAIRRDDEDGTARYFGGVTPRD